MGSGAKMVSLMYKQYNAWFLVRQYSNEARHNMECFCVSISEDAFMIYLALYTLTAVYINFFFKKWFCCLQGAQIALNVDRWYACVLEICACHDLPSPKDDEKLPVGTGSNPVSSFFNVVSEYGY